MRKCIVRDLLEGAQTILKGFQSKLFRCNKPIQNEKTPNSTDAGGTGTHHFTTTSWEARKLMVTRLRLDSSTPYSRTPIDLTLSTLLHEKYGVLQHYCTVKDISHFFTDFNADAHTHFYSVLLKNFWDFRRRTKQQQDAAQS